MGEKCPIKFSLVIAISTVTAGFFYMPQSCDMGQTALNPFRRKACWGFFAQIIRRLRPGLNPRTSVPEASMLTTGTPKPLQRVNRIPFPLKYTTNSESRWHYYTELQ